MTGTLRHNHYIIGIKKILMTLLVSMFLCPAMLWGQDQSEYKVSGIIMEAESDRPLGFCKIYVTDSLGQQVRRTITLDDGIFRFSVKDGSYSVLFTNTGHRSVTSSVKVAGKDVDMGEIFMEIGEEIDGAGVSAAPLLTLTGDRYIYDVSRDPDKDKISMTEMMTRIPQLRTASKDGKLEFNNEKVAEIRIDDTENGMISASRQYPMEFIKAGYMKTIELVMPDSQEYHNEHPILLITLARPLPYGFAGNIEGQANTKNDYSPAVDLVANTPIIGVGVSYGYGYSGEPALTNRTTREMTDGTVMESQSVRSSKSHSHNMGMNIFRGFLNDRIRFNASLSGSFANASSFSESTVNNVPSVTSTGTSQSPFRLNGAVRLSGSFGPETVRSNMRKHQWSLGYSYRDSYRSSETEHVYPSYSAIQSSYNDEREHRLQATLKLRDIVRKPFTASLYLQHPEAVNHYLIDCLLAVYQEMDDIILCQSCSLIYTVYVIRIQTLRIDSSFDILPRPTIYRILKLNGLIELKNRYHHDEVILYLISLERGDRLHVTQGRIHCFCHYCGKQAWCAER